MPSPGTNVMPPLIGRAKYHPRRRHVRGKRKFSQFLKTPYFKHYDGAVVSPQDNFVAEHCGVSSLVIHPEDPKLKLDERDGLFSITDSCSRSSLRKHSLGLLTQDSFRGSIDNHKIKSCASFEKKIAPWKLTWAIETQPHFFLRDRAELFQFVCAG